MRRLERQVVKAKAKSENKSFHEAWAEYRENKYITKDNDGNILENRTPKNTQPKKQNHFDSCVKYSNMISFLKSLEGSRKAKIEGDAE